MGCVRMNDKEAKSLNLQTIPGMATVSEDEYNKQGEWVEYLEKLNPKAGNECFKGAYKVILIFLHSVHWERIGWEQMLSMPLQQFTTDLIKLYAKSCVCLCGIFVVVDLFASKAIPTVSEQWLFSLLRLFLGNVPLLIFSMGI